VAISSTNSLKIKVEKGTAFHLDGEGLFTDQASIKIKLFSGKLKVVI
jgi:hypothetical protein